MRMKKQKKLAKTLKACNHLINTFPGKNKKNNKSKNKIPNIEKDKKISETPKSF